MGFDGLLTFFGIGVAILAIADPVRRRAFALFVHKYLLPVGIALSFVLILSAKLLREDRPVIDTLLQAVAFLCLVALAQRSWRQYSDAKLTATNASGFAELLAVALLERRFSEIDRVLSKNRENLSALLSPTAKRLLFEAELVQAMVDSRSLIHLELLSELPFLESLENRHLVVDVVVRALLEAQRSPVRSAVIRAYGGDETADPDPESLALFCATFENPRWYLVTRADYPLLLAALEALRSGILDENYNKANDRYLAMQGISLRARCPVFLAQKTHVLALSAAVRANAEGDFYVSDFGDLFREILRRSTFGDDDHESPFEPQTPYAFLLTEILSDLWTLSRRALQVNCREATSEPLENSQAGVPWPRVGKCSLMPPPRFAVDLARIWSFCCLELAKCEDHQVGARFRRNNLRCYIDFLLQLRHSPHEAFGETGEIISGLEEWHELFVSEFRDRLQSSDPRILENVIDAIGALDIGKEWVRYGRDSLKKELGITDDGTQV